MPDCLQMETSRGQRQITLSLSCRKLSQCCLIPIICPQCCLPYIAPFTRLQVSAPIQNCSNPPFCFFAKSTKQLHVLSIFSLLTYIYAYSVFLFSILNQGQRIVLLITCTVLSNAQITVPKSVQGSVIKYLSFEIPRILKWPFPLIQIILVVMAGLASYFIAQQHHFGKKIIKFEAFLRKLMVHEFLSPFPLFSQLLVMMTAI